MSTPTPDPTTRYDEWSILEVMGHVTYGARVSEATLAGQPVFRVDVPEVPGTPAFTCFVGAGSLYRLTPVSEAVARAVAARVRREPVTVYCPELQPIERPYVAGALTSGDDDEHTPDLFAVTDDDASDSPNDPFADE